MCHMLDTIIYYAILQSTQTKEKLKILKLTHHTHQSLKMFYWMLENQSLPGKFLSYVFLRNFI